MNNRKLWAALKIELKILLAAYPWFEPIAIGAFLVLIGATVGLFFLK